MNDTGENQHQERTENTGQRSFVRDVSIFYGVGLVFLLVIALVSYAATTLLLVFSCILFAVLLYGLSKIVERHLHIPHKLAVGLVVLAIAVVLGLLGWLAAPRISEQAQQLVTTIPSSLDQLKSFLENQEWFKQISGGFSSLNQISDYASMLITNIGTVFTVTLGALASAAIILFVGIYFAAQPHIYIKGILRLVPPKRRRRAQEVMQTLGHALFEWLLGKMLSMLIVGTVTTIGLYMLGIPLALILGFIAGLLDFIPYLGPIMAGVPAVLIAITDSPTTGLYVALLFFAVQAAEGYLLAPIIDRKMVSLPPALTISMQVLLGTFFGLAGVALATPLTTAIAVLVTTLYVQDVLGDHVKPPGED